MLSQLVSWVESDSNMCTPALRTLGNLCSGSADMTEAVVTAGGVPAMVSCLRNASKDMMKKETLWALSNVSAGTSEQVRALLDAGAPTRPSGSTAH